MPELQIHSEHSAPTPAPAATHSRTIVASVLILAVILIDQVIKFEVKTHMALHESIEVTSWFHILFTENRGMAFGMQFAGTMVLAIFRVVAITFFILALGRLIRRKAPMGLIVCLSMVIAGSVGNIIDNMFNGLLYTESLPYDTPAHLVPLGEGYGEFLSGRVIDMFYFPLFTWPEWMPLLGGNVFFGAIFNFADASISCGAVALALFYGRWLTRSTIFKS